MNFRHYIGSTFNKASNAVLSNKLFPLTRYVTRGDHVYYDIQRFAGIKNLNFLFDVGANIGQTATGLIQYFPASNIYCFEPVSTSFEILSAKFSQYSNLHCIKKGLGSTSGTANIVLHQDSQLNTLMSNGPREDSKIGEETILLQSIDEFVHQNYIPYIDLLKMDVQGWEMEVLKGAKSLLSNKRIRFIFTEVGFRRDDRDMQYFSEINEFLEKQGFWFCGFYDQFRWGEKKQYVGFSNALYLQPEFIKSSTLES